MTEEIRLLVDADVDIRCIIGEQEDGRHLIRVGNINAWRLPLDLAQDISPSIYLCATPSIIVKTMNGEWLDAFKHISTKTSAKTSLVQLLDINRMSTEYELCLESPLNDENSGRFYIIDLAHQLSVEYEQEKEDERRQTNAGYIYNIAVGLQHLHQRQIVHGSLTSKHVWMFQDDYQPSSLRAKLAPSFYNNWSDQPNTPNYQKEDIKSDILQLAGLTFYAMSSNDVAPANIRRMLDLAAPAIAADTKLPSKYTYSLRHLLIWMTNGLGDGLARADIAHIVNHPVFWSEEKSMNFIFQVYAHLTEGNNAGLVKEFNTRIKNMFPNFNWEDHISTNVLELLRGNERKDNFQTGNLYHLIRMLRNKSVHYLNLDNNLFTEEYFGTDRFSKEKYNRFFLQRVNYLVIFLYTELSQSWLDKFIFASITRLRKIYEVVDNDGCGYNFPLMETFKLLYP